MKTSLPRWILPVATAMVAVAAPFSYAASEAEATAGRNVLKNNAEALVGVELVVSTKGGGGRGGGGGPRERKVETSGTVISATGLTVVSLAMLDSGASAAGGRGGGTGESDTEFKEVKLRLADNSEISALVVLKDAELDIAFIAPTGEGAVRDYKFIDLANSADAPVLGTFFEIARLGKTLQRLPVVNTVTVIGTIERPRKLYLLEDQATLGCPVFDMQGKLVGIGLVYAANGSLIRAVIVPAADISDIAKQATAAREKASGMPMALPPAP